MEVEQVRPHARTLGTSNLPGLHVEKGERSVAKDSPFAEKRPVQSLALH
jgi:hypothetical protein